MIPRMKVNGNPKSNDIKFGAYCKSAQGLKKSKQASSFANGYHVNNTNEASYREKLHAPMSTVYCGTEGKAATCGTKMPYSAS